TENRAAMNGRRLAGDWPVPLGGAAPARGCAEDDLGRLYEGEVRYAKHAFEGLRLMDSLMARKRGEVSPADDELEAKRAERRARRERSKRIMAARAAAANGGDQPAKPQRSDVATDVPVPRPPFWGSEVVRGVSVADYA